MNDTLAKVSAAIEAAIEEVPRDETTKSHLSARRVDALQAILDAYLQPDPARSPKVNLVVHVDVDARTATIGVGDGGPQRPISFETLERYACEAGMALVLERNGTSVDVGRTTRRPPAALRRAVVMRDHGRCRFPLCSNRARCATHHIRHWTRQGDTKKTNLVLLCPFHHRALHEGGWTIEGDPDGVLTFKGPRGEIVSEHAPPLPRATPNDVVTTNWARGVDVRPDSLLPDWYGERFDLDWAVSILCERLDRAVDG